VRLIKNLKVLHSVMDPADKHDSDIIMQQFSDYFIVVLILLYGYSVLTIFASIHTQLS
jgi:hypothetical protein